MFCMECGTRLPANAEFCCKCGCPQQQDSGEDGVHEWELCDVEFIEVDSGGLFRCPHGVFCAFVVGHPRPKRVAVSREVRLQYGDRGGIAPDITAHEQQRVLKELTDLLMRRGWRPIGQVGPWSWQHRFTRLKPHKR